MKIVQYMIMLAKSSGLMIVLISMGMTMKMWLKAHTINVVIILFKLLVLKKTKIGVPGCKSQMMQGENKSFTAWYNSTEQTTSSPQYNDGQGSKPGRGVAGNISESEEGLSHCRINFQRFQSREESPDNCKVGISLKEGTIPNTHVQEPARLSVPKHDSCCRNITKTDVVILDDDTDSGVSTCEVNSSTEEEEEDIRAEMNNDDVIYDAELDSDDMDTESDCGSCENVRLFYQHTRGKNPDSKQPVFLSADVSDSEDDCLVYEPCSHSQLNSRSTVGQQNVTTSEYYRYISESDSDSSDCEILEGSYGEIRQKWEAAVMMRRVSKGFQQKKQEAVVEVCMSGLNLETDSPGVEGGSEVTTNWKDAGFKGCNIEESLRNSSNFAGESSMNDFSDEMNVASFRTSTELDTCNLSTSGMNISARGVPGQNTNDINMHTGTKNLNKSRKTETRIVDTPEDTQHHSQGEENQNLIATCSTEVPNKQLFIDEKSTEYISNREKLKETEEFRVANQEEWAHRQQELRRQAEEVQRLRRKRKAEALRIQEMEQRQKRRLEEIRVTQKKDEQTMDLKEQLRDRVRSRLEEVASTCKDMASLLICLGIPVEGGTMASSRQLNAAYKKALLRFHPDRASVSNGDLHYQVDAEETFKMISRLKDTLLPIAASSGSKTYW